MSVRESFKDSCDTLWRLQGCDELSTDKLNCAMLESITVVEDEHF